MDFEELKMISSNVCIVPPEVDQWVMKNIQSRIELQKHLNEEGFCCEAAMLWNVMCEGEIPKKVCQYCERRGAKLVDGKVIWG